MKLAISNIAWSKREEPAVAKLLMDMGVKYVEIAPTKNWNDPTTIDDEEIEAYKKFWSDHDIEIIAFQAMLFGRPELTIFDNEVHRQKTLEYLEDFIGLAPKFGAKVLVFGSPKNRQLNGHLTDEAKKTANMFFDKLGNVAKDNHAYFCIEPNPTDYDCNFVTDARQGIELVESVGNSGFGLHLDLAGMTLAGDDIEETIKRASSILRHFHISAPFLDEVKERENIDYRAAAEALKKINYDNFVSIEMKPGNPSNNLQRVENAVRFAQKIF